MQMKILAAVALASSVLVGCSNNAYKPPVTDTQLSSYAGQAVYPAQMHSEMAVSVFASVAPDSTITIYNAGDVSMSSFELWVNKEYTLHVDKMDARNVLTIDPNTMYNKKGINLKTIASNQIAFIQIQTQDKLWNVQGPIIAH